MNGSAAQGNALEIDNVVVRFGGVVALDGASFKVNQGDLCGLVGPNGAGKTTLFNCITRSYDLTNGRIRYSEQDLAKKHRRDIVGLGIARTFQNLGVYGRLSVLDNTLIGMHHARKDSFFSPLYRPALSRSEERRGMEWCRHILQELALGDVADRRAGDLPYGTLKRLEVARALAAKPSLLLLDEPAAGLTQGEVTEFGDMLRDIRTRFSLTVLLVEHNMRLVMSLCERIVVLHLGRKLAEGTPVQIQNNKEVVRAYLGGGAHDRP